MFREVLMKPTSARISFVCLALMLVLFQTFFAAYDSVTEPLKTGSELSATLLAPVSGDANLPFHGHEENNPLFFESDIEESETEFHPSTSVFLFCILSFLNAIPSQDGQILSEFLSPHSPRIPLFVRFHSWKIFC